MMTIFQFLGIFILFIAAAAGTTAKTPQCKTNPCTNGGSCFVNITSSKPECFCPMGFIGPTCADIDVCAGTPCLNGGSCMPDVAVPTYLYRCDCLPGFSGHNCSTRLSPCASNPCLNGTCIDHISNTTFKATCDCFPGYTGVHCETYGGLCLEQPCTSLDSKAQCHNKDTMYQCECSSDDYFGLNCESPSQNCKEDEESYCVCLVNDLPVKIPIPSPAPYDDGINAWDILLSLLGILFGWIVGTVLLHVCCRCFAKDYQPKKPKRPWSRPQSVQSNATASSGISSTTCNDDPMTPTSAGSHNRVAPMDTALPVASQGNHRPTNVYRAAFVDELSHTVSTRKSTSTYLSGKQDW